MSSSSSYHCGTCDYDSEPDSYDGTLIARRAHRNAAHSGRPSRDESLIEVKHVDLRAGIFLGIFLIAAVCSVLYRFLHGS